jgi:hypothetical protein
VRRPKIAQPASPPMSRPVGEGMAHLVESTEEWSACVMLGRLPPPKLIRETINRFAIVLRAYSRTENWLNQREPREHLPVSVTRVIANWLAYVAAGRIPPPFQAAVTAGRPKASPAESRAMGAAVAYIWAAKHGILDDASPVGTVAKSYGVTPRSVMRWCQKMACVRPGHFVWDSDRKSSGPIMSHLMKEYGARYRVAGRSTAAIAHRGGKRRRASTGL